MLLKVVNIVEDLKIGGLERNLAHIVDNLDRKMFSVEVWCIDRGGVIADELISKGYRVRILGLKTYHNPMNILRLSHLLSNSRVHILHSHGYFANTMGRLAAILARIPVIIAHVQNSHWTINERSERNYKVDRILSIFSNKIIACSRVAADFQIQRAGIKRNKISVIHNCADTNLFSLSSPPPALPQAWGIKKTDFLIGNLARLTKVKGHRNLLEAVSLSAKSINNLKVVICGDGDQKEALLKLRNKLKLDDLVIFAGNRNDVQKILPLLDVYIHPTLIREGLPLAILEAMAAKLPVIATDIGGVREAVVDSRTGLIVPPGNPVSLSDAILRLYKSKPLRQKMGNEGYYRCLNFFNIDTMIREITSTYLNEFKKSTKAQIL